MEPGLPGRPWAASSHLPFLSFSHCFHHLNRSSGCWSSLRHVHSASHQDTGRDGDGEDQKEPWLHPTGGEKNALFLRK